ncbi:carboxymuconolactone decarboxylase family protein [Anaerocolumna xylanovorans]|nr:carboxymuconolactone decarboxylase family protein [Anaerocolumna xylanovorans]
MLSYKKIDNNIVERKCVNEYKAMMKAALNFGVTPVEIKDVKQST